MTFHAPLLSHQLRSLQAGPAHPARMSEETPKKPSTFESKRLEENRRKAEDHSQPPAGAGKVPPAKERENSEGDTGLDGFK